MSFYSDPKLVTLRSSDGIEFPVLNRVALMSNTLKKIVQHPLRADIIPLYNIEWKILAMVIEYCDRHSRPESEQDYDWESFDLEILNCDDQNLMKILLFEFMKNENLKRFDFEFLKNLDRAELVSLGIAANHLDIPGLSLIVYKKHAEIMKDMNEEEICEYFGINN